MHKNLSDTTESAPLIGGGFDPHFEPTTRNYLDGFLRLKQVLERVPVSKSLLYSKIASGEWPAPVRLSARVSGWRRCDVDELLRKLSESQS